MEYDAGFIQPALITGLWQFKNTVSLKELEKHGIGSIDVARIIWIVVSITPNMNLVYVTYSPKKFIIYYLGQAKNFAASGSLNSSHGTWSGLI